MARVDDLRQEVMLAEAARDEAEQRYTRLRSEKVAQFTNARRQSPERCGLVRQVFAVIDEQLVPVLQQIAEYDRATEEMGGRAGERVFAELDLTNPENIVDFRRERWQQTGEL